MIPALNLCCTGSIGIISIPNLILTMRLGFQTNIRVFLTAGAKQFVTEQLFTTLTSNAVYTAVDRLECEAVGHMSSPTLIAPASANAIAAMAIGLPSHMAANLAMSSMGTVFVAPAMNKAMWEKPVTRRSLDTLREFGYIIIEPETGREISDLSISHSALASVDTIIKTLIANLPITSARAVE